MIEQAKALLDSLAITFDFPILEFIRNYLTNQHGEGLQHRPVHVFQL